MKQHSLTLTDEEREKLHLYEMSGTNSSCKKSEAFVESALYNELGQDCVIEEVKRQYPNRYEATINGEVIEVVIN